jgi:hypothetical protein
MDAHYVLPYECWYHSPISFDEFLLNVCCSQSLFKLFGFECTDECYSRIALCTLTFISTFLYLHDHIISLRGDVWVHKTSVTPPLFSEVPVSSPESDMSTFVRYEYQFFYLVLALFQQCGIFVFHFITVREHWFNLWRSMFFLNKFFCCQI